MMDLDHSITGKSHMGQLVLAWISSGKEVPPSTDWLTRRKIPTSCRAATGSVKTIIEYIQHQTHITNSAWMQGPWIFEL